MTIINETERLVVEFASAVEGHDVYPIGQESQVWLVCEHRAFDQPPVWRMMSDKMEWSYSLVGGICQAEVLEAEFSSRLDNGKHLKAEAYIELWRTAMKQSIPITELGARGLALEVTFTNSTQYLLGLGEDHKAKATAALESVFLKSKDETQCSWQITLDSLEACRAYSLLNRLRCYGDAFESLYSETWRLVQSSGISPVATQPTYDLFSGVEVTA